MKYLLTLSILIGALPYLFLGSSVEAVNGSKKEYQCVVSKAEDVSAAISFGSVYYSFGDMSGDHRIVLPYFFKTGKIFSAICGDKTFNIGVTDWVKEGDKIRVNTEINKVSFFGKEVTREESIYMFGTN